MGDVLEQLTKIIEQRFDNPEHQDSYVAKLSQSGLDKILEKVGEEAIETIVAAKNAEQNGDNAKLIYETADLLFHTLVMLTARGTDINQVLAELERRFGTSGLEEKRSRKS